VELGPADQYAVAQRAAQLGQEGAERGLGRGRRPAGPQQVDQLGTAAVALAVHDQVGEQQAALPSRQRSA